MKTFPRTISTILALLLFAGANASTVDSLKVYSKSMKKDIDVVCIIPDKMSSENRCPVIYLLHGYGGNHRTWSNIQPALPEIADAFGLVFVCPDGKKSWYWDSPKDPSSRYETFVSKELVRFVDKKFKTIADRGHRAITGLSMGGHGAMWLAIRHKDVFGACGSLSGGLDIRPFPENWDIKKQLGSYEENKVLWESHTVINQLHTLKNGELAIIFDCGFDDFFFEVNNDVHRKLLEMGIDHDYEVRPGAHNVPFWHNAIDYHILFFMKYFNRQPTRF